MERDDASLAPYLKKAQEVVVFKKTGAIPHGLCKTSMDAPAKKCSVCKQCFSGKYPATQKA